MMESRFNSNRDQIRRSVEAADRAIETIREGDLIRRQVSLELRDLQLTMHEDFQRLRNEMDEFMDVVYRERVDSAKWMNEKLSVAKNKADQAIKSNLMVSDVQLLEKKVDILKDSVINVNKAYYNYEKNVDMKDLMEQITEMVYRTEKKERDLINKFQEADKEEKIEKIFRSAIEELLCLKSTNPAILEEAKKLAHDLRVYRDAAANNNLFNLIAKPEQIETSSPSGSSAELTLESNTSSKTRTSPSRSKKSSVSNSSDESSKTTKSKSSANSNNDSSYTSATSKSITKSSQMNL